MQNKTISECLYGTPKQQKYLEFFDRCLYGDVLAFLDFSLILKQAQSGDALAISLRDTVRSYTHGIYNALDLGDHKKVKKLLSGLKETKYTQIGYCESKNDGSGVSGTKAKILYKGLSDFHKIAKKGNTSFLVIPFALDGISNDGASDILTAILKSELIGFTQELAKQNSWPTKTTLVDNILNTQTLEWEHKMVELPIANGNPIILYPKKFINTKSRLANIFKLFKTYLFEKYIKYDDKFKSYWSDDKEFITQKQLIGILQTEDAAFKSVIRDYLFTNYAALDDFENNLDFEPLSDEELELLQTCRVKIGA